MASKRAQVFARCSRVPIPIILASLITSLLIVTFYSRLFCLGLFSKCGSLGFRPDKPWGHNGAGGHNDTDDDTARTYDVLIYGATPAAIAAAIQTVRMDKTVAIVCSESHIGGLTTSGLGWTDSKNGNAIGGIAREFYSAIYDYYKSDDAWFTESRRDYQDKRIWAQPGSAIEDDKRVQWTFEAHVAEEIFEKGLAGIPIFRNETLVRSSNGVSIVNETIMSITTQSGRVFKGSMFIDAGYDGDLMAEAGVPYRVGREGRSEYDESWAGILVAEESRYKGIDPYVIKGDPTSGLLQGIEGPVDDPDELNYEADPHRLQSYNYRLSLTKEPYNRVPFFKPTDYNESSYELLFRYIESGYHGPFFTYQLMPNGKTDTNANGAVSTDLMGDNYDILKFTNYADDSYEDRKATAQRQKTFQQGFFWTLANHDRVPESIREDIGQWGYAQDEWVDNGNWPYEIYIREARRMRGVYTINQNDVQYSHEYDGDSVIGLGCYSLDVHESRRVVIDGEIYDEGLVHVKNPTPYAIPFESIIPESNIAKNFLNPVTLSGTHIAISTIRMEPTYMVLGQSAATAAVLALEQGVAIQDVDREALTARLMADGQYLEW